MRIGLFTDTYLPDINGVVSSVELLRKKLEELGNDVYVICTYKGLVKVKYEGKIIRLPGIEIKKLYGYTLSTPLHFLMIEEIKKLNLDIIHAETEFGVGIFANIVASTLNIPLVRTYHTTYEDYTHYVNFIHSKTLDKGLKKGVALISKAYGNNCVRLISPSKKTADMLKKYGVVSEIDIIPTGVELDRFDAKNVDLEKANDLKKEYGIKDDEKLLLFVGRIAKEKAIDQIINAFVKVKEENLKIKLLIVGAGPSLEELQDLVKKEDLEDYIFFAGKKPFSQIPIYYHGADGFISASTSETQGMTYIEALASGLVVLAHYDAVLTDLIIEDKNGYFFEDNNIYETIKKFNDLSQDKYQEMTKYAIQSAQKYDAGKFGEDSLKLYEEAIEDYKYSYVIKKTKLKDDCVVLSLEAFDGEEVSITLSLHDYYNGGYRNDSKISKLVYNTLLKKQEPALAYRACLKRLANKDYTVKQMKDYLNDKFDLEKEKIDELIQRLIDYNLLDDKRFAINKTNSFNASFLSTRAIKTKLKKLGIDNNIIEEVVTNNVDEELLKAEERAQKYLKMAKNKSLNHKKQTIYTKLLNDGFASDIAKEAMNILDFSSSVLMEKDILRKEANKAKKKYEKKYEGSELRNRVYLSLVAKGFGYDNIYAIINEMEL